MLFLSLNIDDNPGLIAPFLKEQKLDLLVIPAHDYVSGTLNVNGIPQNWIVDSKGVVRLKGIGYDATEKWETGMKNAIEKVNAGANSTASP